MEAHKLGSSPNPGKAARIFEEEVGVVAEAIGHAVDDLDFVVNALDGLVPRGIGNGLGCPGGRGEDCGQSGGAARCGCAAPCGTSCARFWRHSRRGGRLTAPLKHHATRVRRTGCGWPPTVPATAPLRPRVASRGSAAGAGGLLDRPSLLAQTHWPGPPAPDRSLPARTRPPRGTGRTRWPLAGSADAPPIRSRRSCPSLRPSACRSAQAPSA